MEAVAQAQGPITTKARVEAEAEVQCPGHVSLLMLCQLL